MSTAAPPPLTPADCDLRDFASMFLDVHRLLTSETWINAAKVPFLSHALMSLWTASWHQKPAASLPDSDAVLQRLSMLDPKAWAKVKVQALEGWVRCDDGRLYHPVVAEKALAAWTQKKAQRSRTEAARRAREEARQRQSSGATDDVTEPRQRQSQSLSQTLSQAPKGEGEGEGDSSSEPNGSAEIVPLDPDKRAWDDGTALLTTAGMTVASAKSFIGRLLSEYRLQARDLLSAIGQAIANRTPDPKAYLRKAASSIARRRDGKGGDLLDDASKGAPWLNG